MCFFCCVFLPQTTGKTIPMLPMLHFWWPLSIWWLMIAPDVCQATGDPTCEFWHTRSIWFHRDLGGFTAQTMRTSWTKTHKNIGQENVTKNVMMFLLPEYAMWLPMDFLVAFASLVLCGKHRGNWDTNRIWRVINVQAVVFFVAWSCGWGFPPHHQGRCTNPGGLKMRKSEIGEAKQASYFQVQGPKNPRIPRLLRLIFQFSPSYSQVYWSFTPAVNRPV